MEHAQWSRVLPCENNVQSFRANNWNPSSSSAWGPFCSRRSDLPTPIFSQSQVCWAPAIYMNGLQLSSTANLDGALGLLFPSFSLLLWCLRPVFFSDSFVCWQQKKALEKADSLHPVSDVSPVYRKPYLQTMWCDLLACSFVGYLLNDSYMPGTMFITGRQLCLGCDMCPKLHLVLDGTLRTSVL